MNVLLTGAFGNIGQSALDALLKRGHQVRCFDLKTKANERAARSYVQRAQIIWGDLRRPEDLKGALRDIQIVVHLAFVIPSLSATGVSSETDPEWAREINVGGMKNLLDAMKQQPQPPKILFSSSLHIYGKTQHLPPPRTVFDTPHPIEHYAKHKVECEEMIQRSGLTWTIFRLGASLPIRLLMDPAMFDVPLNNRIEFVHRRDVGLAIANGLETDEIWGKVWHIGGGPDCQLYQRELVEGVLEAVGVGMLPEDAFTNEPYPTDWLETEESQRVLNFQRRTLSDYIEDVKKRVGFRRFFIRLFRPLIRAWILRKSRVQV
ncbi:MAG: NAD(P)-dependent oxidoreductase [Anaerolineales bacterium]|nr:MAG: NAD(P)-dependent oxidoreductase [Anaerolineales bacterium]